LALTGRTLPLEAAAVVALDKDFANVKAATIRAIGVSGGRIHISPILKY